MTPCGACRDRWGASMTGVRGLAGLLLLSTVACSSKLALDVRLIEALRPDPFEDVATVRLRALEGGRLVRVGEGRWDQGPLDLDTLVSPEADRFVVEGLSSDGRVVSSGASGPLDLLTAPPEDGLEIVFTRVGVLSVLEEADTERIGGRAVELPGGGVLVAGGVDADGCAREDTEIYSMEGARLERGPPLVGGRVDDFHLLALGDGRSIVVGGRAANGCGAAQDTDRVVVFDGRSARNVEAVGFNIPGASYAVVASSEIVAAGGEGDIVSRTQVARLDLASGAVRSIGTLDAPRAWASPAVISSGRIALLGGRAQRDPATALDSTSVFVPSRGAALDERIGLGRALVAPATRRTAAGGVVYAGGRSRTGEGHAEVRMLVVKTERDFPLGDSTVVTSISSTIADGRFVDVGDGSALLLSRERRAAYWTQLLPRRARALDTEGAALIGGGRLADGRVVLRSEAGAYLSFNPGLSPLGIAARDGRLAVDEGEVLDGVGVGVVPLRPDAWQLTTEGLVVTRPDALEGEVVPNEWAVFVGDDALDFDLELDVRLEPRARAAVLFGLSDQRFDHVVLGGQISAHRQDTTLDCPPVDAPVLEVSGFHRVRVVRSGERVTVAIDGATRFECVLRSPRVGRVALGGISGSATFDRVTRSAP